MSRSLFGKLHRRFGSKLSGVDTVGRAQDKQSEFTQWMGLASARDCSRIFDKRVAIVGGGFAGLSAAWTLGQFGITSTVFEARDTYGGRVQSDRSLIPGRIVEMGAELIGMNHPMWLSLARKFGLGLIVLTGEDQYAGAGLDMPFRIRGKDVSNPEKLYKQMNFVFRQISNDAKTITEPFAPWTATNASALDAQSVADKVAEYARLVPKTVRHPLLVDAIEFELGNDHVLPMKEQSYLGLLSVVSGGRLGQRDTHLDGYWNHREDYRCAEGNASLGAMMLESGRRIQLVTKSPVKKIEIGETDLGVKVTWLNSTRGVQSSRFDYVILTVPPSVWKKITISPPLPPDRQMGWGRAVKYISVVNGRFWIKAGMAPNGAWDELGQAWEATENQGVASRGIAMTVYAGGAYVPAADAKRHFKKQLLKLYPQFRMQTERYVDWPNVEWIETGFAVPKVGQVTTIGKFLSIPHAKRLYFAGEHTCMAYFGYMEGALQSGARAARTLLASCLKTSAATLATARAPQQILQIEQEAASSNGRRGRRESETAFLQQLLREAGDGTAAGVSPAALVRAALHNQPPMDDLQNLLTVVAVPSQQPKDTLRAGDWMLRAIPATGDVGHVSVLSSDDLFTQSMLASEGIAAESAQPGFYGLVTESGAFPHSRSQPFARRLLNSRGLVPPNTVFLRPRSLESGTTVEPGEDLTYEQIVERVRQELNLAFPDPDDPGLFQRRRRLRTLFTSVPGPCTTELHARLGAKPTSDALSRLFHGRLPTVTRRDLLKILEDRFPAAKPPAPSPTPAPAPTKSPCRRGMGAMRPLLAWERSFLAIVHDKSEADFKSVAILVGPIILPGLMAWPLDAIVKLALKDGNAITIENNIWFPRAIDTSTVHDLGWLVHESVHVVDYAVAGTEAFLKAYIQQAIVKGFRHDDIPHEIRANRLEAAAEAMLARFPDLMKAIGACDGNAIIALLTAQKDAYRTALNESMKETIDEVDSSGGWQ